MCNPCGFIMEISSRYYRLLIYVVKRNTKKDGIGPFNMVSDRPIDQVRIKVKAEHRNTI